MGIKSVVFAGNYAHYSGALQVFRNLASVYHARGIRTTYMHHLRRDDDIVPDMSMFDKVKFFDEVGYDDCEYLWGLGHDMADFANNEGDVVHSSLLPLQWRYHFKRRLRIPHVETYHSLDGWKRAWGQYKYRLAEGVEKPADATVAVSQGLAKAMRTDSGLPVDCVYNGVPVPAAMGPGGPYVTYCGRISDGKGLPEWIALARLIREQLPESRFQWIGGYSPGQDKCGYDCLLSAAPWLEITGFKEDIGPYLARAAVLLLTSPSEGLPMVILEAAAHGVPSLAYDTGDVRETGCIIAQPGFVVSDCVDIIDRRLRVSLDSKFHLSAMAEGYWSIYERVCRGFVPQA